MKFKRTKQYILEGYEDQRAKKLQLLDVLSVDQHLERHGKNEYCLLDHKIVYNAHHTVHKRLLEILTQALLCDQYSRVIELGSGDGRNIIKLAEKFPDLKFIGLELSPTSIHLSNKTAALKKIDNCQFIQCDLTKPETYACHLDNGFVFTMHCLEEMPRLFVHVIESLTISNPKFCMFIEPIFTWSTRSFFLDLARLIRIYNRDRLRGFKKQFKRLTSGVYTVNYIDLGLGENVVNPSTLAIITKVNND